MNHDTDPFDGGPGPKWQNVIRGRKKERRMIKNCEPILDALVEVLANIFWEWPLGSSSVAS